MLNGLFDPKRPLEVIVILLFSFHPRNNRRISLSEKVRTWARGMKRDGVTLWFAYRHAGTPLMAKLLCVLVVTYTLSPIDLIPDFIPVLGYLDDAILLPCLIWIAIRLIPSNVIAECRSNDLQLSK